MIIDPVIRRRTRELIARRHHVHRPDRPHQEPHRRAARSAVIEERHRTMGIVTDRIRNVRHLGGRLILGIAQRDRSDPRRIRDGLPIDLDGMVRNGIARKFLRKRRRRRLGSWNGRRRRARLRLGKRRNGPARKRTRDRKSEDSSHHAMVFAPARASLLAAQECRNSGR